MKLYISFFPTYSSHWQRTGTGYVQYKGSPNGGVIRTSPILCECGNAHRLCHPEA